MCSLSRITLIAVTLISLSLSSCCTKQPEGAGFAISLAESGETILTDEHIAGYVWDQHRIVLTPKGVERWKSFIEFDKSRDPQVRKLRGLAMKEFAVTVEGVEMYRGHFWSMLSSLIKSGVLLYDTSGVPGDELWLSFTRLDGEPRDDPRGHPEIEAYFRNQGKLVEGR